MLADPRALVLPMVTLTLVSVAGFSRYMRSSAIDVLAQDYLRTARAKGAVGAAGAVPARAAQLAAADRHAGRAVLPHASSGGGHRRGGVQLPGHGPALLPGGDQHDFPVLLGCTLIIGVATVVGNLAADFAYGILDPRIRYGDA